ncbi:MAG: malto-oligosyltrehalose synthase, partial [Chloroflexi bacterium]|nr:malto-oligosyltrehalose synthase [Chloroflexota bacterium]
MAIAIKTHDLDALFDEVVRDLPVHRRLPTATYRMQFNRNFRFRDAQKLAAYLRDLGISDCYASPYLRARPDSLHGYDVCDHNSLNPAVGSDEDYDAFAAELQRHGLGQILDVVPNHMGIGQNSNAWWYDVLENGPTSQYANFFDVDWRPLKSDLRNKVLLPILGDQYGRVLENQELNLSFEDGVFRLSYYDHRFPIATRTIAPLLRRRLEQLAEQLGAEHESLLELQSIVTAVGHLPSPDETDPEVLRQAALERAVIRRRLATLTAADETVANAIAETVREYNGVRGDSRSFDLLDELLNEQFYRLSFWRVAAEEINYRRFFDVNELAAIRMENPAVFEEAHRLIMRLLREGKVTGLRIDHPDGLWDPADYFQRLQRSFFLELCRARLSEATPEEWESIEPELVARYERGCAADPRGIVARPLYVIVEKILGKDERVPENWAIYGTVGYEYLNALNGIFVDAANRAFFDDLYAKFIGTRLRFSDLVNSSKKMIMLVSMASELNVLSHQIDNVSERNRWYRDFTLNSLTFALREVIAALPVYRTYVREGDDEVSERDRAHVRFAIAEAKRRNPRTAASIFDFIGDVLQLNYPGNADEDSRREQREFVMKFQQLTGPVTAKGAEDTAFYVYNRLVSLNEVGGEPGHFGIPLPTFHRQNVDRQKLWPYSMLATSTHDTQRGEDVRARINVLSEIPREWRSALSRWTRFNRKKKAVLDGNRRAPDPNEEYLLYQTLLGAWPLDLRDGDQPEKRREFVGRIQAYMLKAIKEAKVNTSWVNPNEAYDNGVQSFVAAILEDTANNQFLADFAKLRDKIVQYGLYNSLSQVLLKLASPGVPDVYQGTELW